MTTVDATAAKNRFGEILEACARGPVAIRRHGRIVAHLVAPGTDTAAPVEERVSRCLAAAGARYATLFGSLARGTARADSDIDVAVWFGRRMSSDLRMAITRLVADASGRAVDLVDLDSAPPLVLARALAGRELVCDGAATRARMAERLARTADERIATERAARAARHTLFQ